MHHEKSEDILDEFSSEVKKIEDQAENIITKAKEDKEKIISQAKSDSVAMIGKKQAEFEKEIETQQNLEKEKIAKEKESFLKKERAVILEMEKSSRKNFDKAVELVISKLEKKIGDIK